MKHILVIASGAADVPHPGLNDKTPLEAAHTPALDSISQKGRIGRVAPVSPPQAGRSDIALLSLLGYAPNKFRARRGAIEARALGVDLDEGDLALSFNLVCSFRGVLDDWGVRRLSPAELQELVGLLQSEIGSDSVSFHHASGYRGVIRFRGGRDLDIECHPPRLAIGQRLADFLPRGNDADVLISLMRQSESLLKSSDINRVRVDLGENPAEAIWPWGPGQAFKLPSFQSRFGRTAVMIASSPLALGLGSALGMKTVNIASDDRRDTTSSLAETYGAAIHHLDRHDLLVVHIQEAHELSREASPAPKVEFIEQLDRRLIGPLLEVLEESPPYRLLVTSDHATSSTRPSAMCSPEVPFALCGQGIKSVRSLPFGETSGRSSDLFVSEGDSLMEYFFGRRTSSKESEFGQ